MMGLGSGRPRVTDADTSPHQLVGRLTPREEAPFGLEVSTAFVRCDTGMPCECTACSLSQPPEATVQTTLELVDWTFENLSAGDSRYFRVATFLLGDSGGTDVAVAMWDVRDGAVILEPVVIATGRGVMGLGRSLRTVATMTSSRLEVFVSVLVEVAGQDVLFLSGLRLERCGS